MSVNMTGIVTYTVLVLALFPDLLLCSQATYHIRSTSDSLCPHEDCLTLSQYASQDRNYSNSDNLTLVFLSGEHFLNTSIDLHFLDSVTLLGNDTSLPNITSKIVCRGSSAFVLQSIHSVEIKALAFVSCGRLDESTVSITIPSHNFFRDTQIETQNVLPAISIVLVINCHLVSCQFQDNVLALLLNKADVYTSNNKFISNTGGLGGAVAAYNSTVFFLGQNEFISNLAEIGGGIFANNSKLVMTGSTAFHANSAKYGGGIHAAYSTLTFGEAANNIQGLSFLQGTRSVLLDNSTSGRVSSNDTGRISHGSKPGLFSDVLFAKNKGRGGAGGAIFTMHSNLSSINTNMTFLLNSGFYGGALSSMGSQVLLGIGSCTEPISCSSGLTEHVLITFIKNSATYSGGAIEAYNSFVAFSDNSILEQNIAVLAGGGMWARADTRVHFRGHTTFLNNTAEFQNGPGGGGVYSFDSELEFKFGSHTAFIVNKAGYGAGIHASAKSNLQMSGMVMFSSNKATRDGGGIYLDLQSRLILRGTGTFTNNSAVVSGGVFSIRDSSTVRFENSNITMATNSAGSNGGAMLVEGGTHCINGSVDFIGNWAEHSGGAVYAENCELDMNGLFRFEDNAVNSSSGYGGAIHVTKTDMRLGGSYNFTNNSAGYGGGLAITSYMNRLFFLELYASLSFHDNHAQKYGGAMFVDDDQDRFCDPELSVIGRNCFITLVIYPRWHQPQEQFTHINNSRLLDCMRHMDFEGNYAEEGGTAIYGGALHNCRVDIDELSSCSYQSECDYHVQYHTCYISGLEAIATLTQMSVEHLTLDPLNIMSDTYKVCICDYHRLNCQARDIDYGAYPGETISLPLVVVENDRTVSADLHADVDSETGRVVLGPLQSTQPITTPCSHLGYTVFSSGTKSARLVLSAEGQCRSPGIPLIVHMDFLPCPSGFCLSQSGLCICAKRLQKYTNSCDINSRTFTRNGDFWLGFDSHGLILHPHCPFDYCKLKTVSFTHNSTDLQCANGRSGTLCGACTSGHSLNLGSSQCAPCSNVYLLLFLPFTIAGFLLVIFLFICKVTVAAGTISGVIFYANVLAVNKSVFFPSGETNILTVFIAWLNLDLGIETCFLDGLDMYTRMWLQFVFPIYIWTLVGLITLVSYYSTTFARIIGPTNPISVLATLFLLSFTKLLRTIIATFSFTTLDYPNDRRVTVWVYDGNIGYLEGKHIPLFLAGLLALLLPFLSYTLLLLFGQCIEAGSNHRLLSWANSPKVRSFLDAYHAPYKNRHRYWTGLLLLLRFVLFIVSALVDINSPKDPSVNLLVLGITMVGLAVWAWNIGSMYRKWYNNALESSFILNLAILALASYQVKVEGGNQAAVVYTSVSVAFVTFLGIITYHILQQVVDSRIWRHSALKSKLNRLKENRRQHQHPTEMTVPSNAPRPHPVTTTIVDLHLRESMLESQH